MHIHSKKISETQNPNFGGPKKQYEHPPISIFMEHLESVQTNKDLEQHELKHLSDKKDQLPSKKAIELQSKDPVKAEHQVNKEPNRKNTFQKDKNYKETKKLE